jgi:flavin reductase (DIM6/NTAB) family NADH-FMN oxidoreductase RutF
MVQEGIPMKRTANELLKGILELPPFPLVLVTVGHNIMTAGAFHFYSFKPPTVMVGIVPGRYTYQLLLEYDDFGINIPRADQIGLVRLCGSLSGRGGADKYEKSGVTPLKASKIKSDLIQECPLNIECQVVHRVDFPGTHRWFVGEVRAVHIDEGYDKDQALMFWDREYRKVGEFLENAR